MRVPFENISKIYRLKHEGLHGAPELDAYLDGIERLHFGGTCYANNYHLYLLLKSLGYDARLCGADMSTPDAHLVVLVTVEGSEYLVDAGYAAPFLEPLARDLECDAVVELGHSRYVLRPQTADGRSRLDLYRNSTLTHGYEINPTPRMIEHFAASIAASYRPQATFLNALLLVRLFPGRSLVLHNLNLIDSTGPTVRERRLTSMAELPDIVETHFGIPAAITADATNGLSFTADAWRD
jgi:arylamine N-acetyltransferase